MCTTLDQVVDAAMQLPAEQQQVLLDLIRGWQIERRRQDIAQGARDSLDAFRAGTLKPRPAQAVIAELALEED